MKAVIQRVSKACVKVDGKVVGEIGKGFMILLGAAEGDTEEDLLTLAKKTVNLRVFTDSDDKMNLSLLDTDGEVLVISQFTLCADVKKGNRPSFIKAMEPKKASEYYDRYCDLLRDLGVKKVEKGIFGADMKVSLVNDGPVTILYDTEIWCKHGD
ncbi:MAG: D-tyrosyl-tRNA(Tyr) deacylase [Ruminococcaceae bacterium]|nr:D-tyrosyl-tRNA(Tyr) deacylase [Oscillospiraceae bacterium]